jgi:hypothetical protein
MAILEGSAIAAVAKTAASLVVKKSIDLIWEKWSNSEKAPKEDVQKALSEHLESTFQKCTKLKTLLQDHQEWFHQIYSTQGFLNADTRITQDDLVELVRSGNTIVLEGLGGGGKSMFVRYLWLKYFADFQDAIPLFIELRNLKNITHNRFIDFLYHTTVKDSSLLSQNEFQAGLARGDYVVILDGFDEISHTKREHYEHEINRLKELYPKLTLFVTSRPDERFFGWHQFLTISVAPLTKEETLELLSKAPYDETEIKKLIKKVDQSLYDSHPTFLSNPLLAYMMLVTQSHNPNFSDRMYLFYENAFEALFYRHDKTKPGGYKRELYTSFEKDKYQRILSYFCLKSYHDEKFEFSNQELESYVSQSKLIEKNVFVDMKNADFIKDTIESVCILKIDGLEHSFVHRSFQEYFAAFCIARVASRNLDKLFSKFANRYGDQVLDMAYDLNPDLFREKYILPVYKKYKKFFDLKRESSIFNNFYNLTELSLIIRIRNVGRNKNDNFVSYGLGTSSELYDFIQNIRNIASYYHEGLFTNGNRVLRSDFDQAFITIAQPLKAQYKEFKVHFLNNEIHVFGVRTDDAADENITEQFNSLNWEKSFSQTYLTGQAKSLHKFVNLEIQAYQNISQKFEEYF